MKMHKTPELLGVCLTVAAIFSTFSVGATSRTATPSSAESRYQQDRANCLSGKTAEDQQTCLKEAGASLQAAREHALKDGGAATLAANQTNRCEPLSGDDRKACMARVEGQGTTSGSVAAGGELHELRTVEPAAPATGGKAH